MSKRKNKKMMLGFGVEIDNAYRIAEYLEEGPCMWKELPSPLNERKFVGTALGLRWVVATEVGLLFLTERGERILSGQRKFLANPKLCA